MHQTFDLHINDMPEACETIKRVSGAQINKTRIHRQPPRQLRGAPTKLPASIEGQTHASTWCEIKNPAKGSEGNKVSQDRKSCAATTHIKQEIRCPILLICCGHSVK